MIRHHSKFIHDPPTSSYAMIDCRDDEFSNSGILQKCVVFRSVEPIFHFAKNGSHQHQRLVLRFMFGLQLDVLRQFPNSLSTAGRNGTREMNRDEISSVFDLPMRQPTAPKTSCLWFSNHVKILSWEKKNSRSRLPSGTFAARRTECGLLRGYDEPRRRNLRPLDFHIAPCPVAGRSRLRSPARQAGPTGRSRLRGPVRQVGLTEIPKTLARRPRWNQIVCSTTKARHQCD
jgi:hypothetical protein